MKLTSLVAAAVILLLLLGFLAARGVDVIRLLELSARLVQLSITVLLSMARYGANPAAVANATDVQQLVNDLNELVEMIGKAFGVELPQIPLPTPSSTPPIPVPTPTP